LIEITFPTDRANGRWAMTFYERYLRQAFGGVLTSPARFAVLAVLAVG
jgi:hypothetical protein